jgi:uncharacterized protein YndB with AHSA1/START domain
VERPQPSAPASAHAEIDIAATERQVWTVLADIAAWPTWNPAIRHAVCEAVLEVGTRFRFATEIGTLKCRVTRVDAPHALSWKGRVLVLGEQQTWSLEPSPTGTHVTVDAAMTGPAARLLRRRLTERLTAVLDAVVQLLRLEAEARALEEHEDATRVAEAERRARAHE